VSTNPKYKSIKGMPDILPKDMPYIRFIEEISRGIFFNFGFEEIRTPILEETKVFTRSIGENTDIVEKEMYSFTDRGGKSLSLRPEGTAAIIRAYIENGFGASGGVTKLFYLGSMFRGERPQKGRLRQFNQIGAEIIGTNDPYSDAELILSLNTILEKTAKTGFKFLINSLGCKKDRDKYKKDLFVFLEKGKDALCENCNRRMKTNVLRVLDCKNEACKKYVKDAPEITKYLCKECEDDFLLLKDILEKEGVSFSQKKDLVRGLDYYTGSIFEVVHSDLGAQDAVAAGGRYDNLTKDMGGPDVGATGYAIGVERMMLILDKDKVNLYQKGVYIVPMDEEKRNFCFNLMCKLRKGNIPCEMGEKGKSFKSLMRKADKDMREIVVIIGENEIKNNEVSIKEMKTGQQTKIGIEALDSFLISKLVKK